MTSRFLAFFVFPILILASSLPAIAKKPAAAARNEEDLISAVRRSAELIGKDAHGKLMVVKEPADKLTLKLAGQYLSRLPPEKTPAHPAAADLYGSIPANAPRMNRSVSIDPSIVRWHSTGLYAAPGELVGLKFPADWVGKGLKVIISGHRDNISLKKNLLRLPIAPSRSFPVDQVRIGVASAFGGAIYIDNQDARPETLPTSNQAKRDFFLLRMSRASGHNLAPFMQDLWGIGLSPEAIEQVAKLPSWIPEGFEIPSSGDAR